VGDRTRTAGDEEDEGRREDGLEARARVYAPQVVAPPRRGAVHRSLLVHEYDGNCWPMSNRVVCAVHKLDVLMSTIGRIADQTTSKHTGRAKN
jgi:hypothetical protein